MLILLSLILIAPFSFFHLGSTATDLLIKVRQGGVMVVPSLALTAYKLVSHHSFLPSFSLGSGRVDHSLCKTSALSDDMRFQIQVSRG